MDLFRKSEKTSSSDGKEKTFNYARKEKILSYAIYTITLCILLEVYEGLVTIQDFIRVESTMNPFVIFADALFTHPFILIMLLFFSKVITELIMHKLHTREKEEVDERGIKIDSTNQDGASRFMSKSEKREIFKYLDYNHPAGNILGVDKDTKELITVPFEGSNFSNRNIGLFGPPGMRKTSGVLIPNIFTNIQAGNSIVCSDPKGELYKETYAAAKYNGYNVRVFNILGTQFAQSDGWDCLKMIRESSNPQSTAQVFANILLSNTSGESGDKFWWSANINCLMLALLYVAKAEAFVPTAYTEATDEKEEGMQEPSGPAFEKERTLKEVYRLITSDDMEMKIASAISMQNTVDKELLSAPYNIWAKHSQKDSIRAGLGIQLNILQSVEVQKLLSTDDINFRELAEKKTIIYIVCADNDDTYKALLTLFVTFMFRETTAIADSLPGSTLPRPLFVILEECGNIGKIPNLARYVSTVRSRNIGMLFCFQTIGQMKDIYGAVVGGKYEWETILAGCSVQLCLGANDDTTADYFSKRSGTMSTVAVREGEHRNKLFPEKLQEYTVLEKRIDISTKGRATLLPDEVRHIKKNEILISPSMDNVTLEHKYFWKNHPFYNIVLIDKETGEVVAEHQTKDRIPRGEFADDVRYEAVPGERIEPKYKPQSTNEKKEVPQVINNKDMGSIYKKFLR